MLLGMGTVFVFLSLLAALTVLMSRLSVSIVIERQSDSIVAMPTIDATSSSNTLSAKDKNSEIDSHLVAAISVAVHRYRRDKANRADVNRSDQ